MASNFGISSAMDVVSSVDEIKANENVLLSFVGVMVLGSGTPVMDVVVRDNTIENIFGVCATFSQNVESSDISGSQVSRQSTLHIVDNRISALYCSIMVESGAPVATDITGNDMGGVTSFYIPGSIAQNNNLSCYTGVYYETYDPQLSSLTIDGNSLSSMLFPILVFVGEEVGNQTTCCNDTCSQKTMSEIEPIDFDVKVTKNYISGSMGGILVMNENESQSMYRITVANNIIDGSTIVNGIAPSQFEILALHAAIGIENMSDTSTMQTIVSNNTISDYMMGLGACMGSNDIIFVGNNIITETLFGIYVDKGEMLFSEDTDNMVPEWCVITCNDLWDTFIPYLILPDLAEISTPEFEFWDLTGLYGNISRDPLFTGYFSLSQGSPCVDAGIDTSGYLYGNVVDDIVGTYRPVGAGYDMGAKERPAEDLSPQAVLMPVVVTQLSTLNSALATIVSSVGANPDPDMEYILDQVQDILDGISLTNSIQATGKLTQALELLEGV